MSESFAATGGESPQPGLCLYQRIAHVVKLVVTMQPDDQRCSTLIDALDATVFEEL